MAQTKARKKFEKHHLQDTLKRRREFAKVKQRHQLWAKKKARRAEQHKPEDGEGAAEDERPAKRIKSGDGNFQDMSVDEFFAGGFEVPSKIARPKGNQHESIKRKRAHIEPQENSSSSESSIERDAAFDDSLSEGEDSEKEQGKHAILTHQDELKALASKDPEFHKYLQENDSELLGFVEDSNFAEVDDLSASDHELGDAQPGNKTKASKDKRAKQGKAGAQQEGDVTKAMVAKWSAKMTEQHSLRSMREAVLAFRAAAHLNDENQKRYKYTISDANVYHDVLVAALRHVPAVLNHHLPVKEHPNGKIRVPTDSKKYRTLTPLLKSHIMAVQHLLQNLSDAATLKITLSSVVELLPYVQSFTKAVRELCRAIVEIWSDVSHSEATRIGAFLAIRRLTVIGDPAIKEHVLRTTYQGLIRSCRATSVHNISAINLMKNSASELWGLVEPNGAYTTGFTFIRQLAIHLRNSIKNNANDSYKTVYNWQYVHSLDFWSRVLSAQCETLREASSGRESQLRPLIYPLTQVTLGAMRLIPTAAYFPLRFQLIRALIRLSNSTNTFIPLATPLYEVLTSAEMKKPPKPSTLKPIDFETNIRVAKGYLRTRVYQDGVGEQVTELLSEFFNLWAKNIAFPELALPVVVMLKRWLKEMSPYSGDSNQQTNGRNKKNKTSGKQGSRGGNRNSKVNSGISLLVQKLEANSRFVEEQRAKVDFAPNNRAGVDGFLKELEWNKTPLGAFVEGQRVQREERRKVLEEGRKADEQERKLKEKANGNLKNANEGFEDSEEESEDAEEEEELEDDDEDELDVGFDEEVDDEI